MKKQKLLILPLLLLLICSLVSPAFAATNAKTPTDPMQTELVWSLQLGKSYADAPSVPAYANGSIYITSRRTLYRLNAATGAVQITAPIAKSNGYATIPVSIANGAVYCPLDDGTVQAFRADSLAPLWTVSAPNGGQPVTPITCAGNKLYTGFWNDIAEDADFICVDAATGAILWHVTRTGGYYGSGAVANGGCVYFGGDTGGDDATGTGTFECRNASTGALLDSITVTGNLRSTPVLLNGQLYFATKAGLLYAVKLAADGTFAGTQTLALGGASTASPAVSGSRLYLGIQTKGYEGKLAVIDTAPLALRETVAMPGYPASTALVSTAYQADSGLTYIYAVCNTPPGALTVVTDRPSGSVSSVATLFTPPEGARNYALSTVAVAEDGTLFYKNDSGYIFALRAAETQPDPGPDDPDPEPEPQPEPTPSLWQRIVSAFAAFFAWLRRIFSFSSR